MLYVVHGNTYYYGYGYIENIFGIYAKKDDAEAAKELITKKLYKSACFNFCDFHFDV